MNHLLNITKNTLPVFVLAMPQVKLTMAAADTPDILDEESIWREYLDPELQFAERTKKFITEKLKADFSYVTDGNNEPFVDEVTQEGLPEDGMIGTIGLRSDGFTTRLVKPFEVLKERLGKGAVLRPVGGKPDPEPRYLRTLDTWSFEELNHWSEKMLDGNRLTLSSTDGTEEVLIFEDDETAKKWWGAIEDGVERCKGKEYVSYKESLEAKLEHDVGQIHKELKNTLTEYGFPPFEPIQGTRYFDIYFKKVMQNTFPDLAPEEIAIKWHEATAAAGLENLSFKCSQQKFIAYLARLRSQA